MYWPGYDGLARYGRWTFLFVSLVFALLLDAFIVLNFYWTAYLTPWQRNGCLVVLFFAWLALSLTAGAKRRAIETVQTADTTENKFSEATVQYLRGNWYETETVLIGLLAKNPRDIEAMLMQATLYRHTKRYDEAQAVLDKLQLLEGAGRWSLEIETERHLIADCETIIGFGT
jgi:hypothetical protein